MPTRFTSDEALSMLMAGNERYVELNMAHPHQSEGRRQKLRDGQNPYAVVLGCADSRVSPTVVFDQGLGDLFIVRVAGNIADNIVLGSLEFAAAELRTPLIVVLGHAQCGAVGATLSGKELPGHLPAIAQAIQPAVDSVKDAPGDMLDNAVKANARNVANQIRASEPVLAKLVRSGKLKVIAAHYDLESGRVEILE